MSEAPQTDTRPGLSVAALGRARRAQRAEAYVGQRVGQIAPPPAGRAAGELFRAQGGLLGALPPADMEPERSDHTIKREDPMLVQLLARLREHNAYLSTQVGRLHAALYRMTTAETGLAPRPERLAEPGLLPAFDMELAEQADLLNELQAGVERLEQIG